MNLQIELDFTKAYSPGTDIAVLETGLCLPAETDPEFQTAPIVQGECYLDKNFMRVRVPCPFCLAGEHIHGRNPEEQYYAIRWSHCPRSQGYRAQVYIIKYAKTYENDLKALLKKLNPRGKLCQKLIH